jgi:hypothetical protein
LIFQQSCANVPSNGRERSTRARRFRSDLPHDAQVRRISWVRGVGRPALAYSGLLVPLSDADRPLFPENRTGTIGFNKLPAEIHAPKTKTPPGGGVEALSLEAKIT